MPSNLRTVLVRCSCLGLLLLAPTDGESLPVDLKIFPQTYRVQVNGTELAPVRRQGTVATYDLPEGEAAMTLTAPGWRPKTVRLTVPRKEVYEDKLEPEQSGLEWVAEIKTGVQPKSVAFTPDGRFLLVPLLEDNGIDILSVSPPGYLRRVAPPTQADRVGFVESAFVPSLDEVWVSQMTTGSIHVFDLSTLDYKTTFSTGGAWSKVIAVSPDGSRGLVSNWESASVTIFDPQSRKQLGRVKTPGIPRGLAFSEDGRSFFAAVFSSGQVERFDTATLQRTGEFDFGEGSAMRHVIASGNRLYLSDMARGRVLVVDLTTGKTLATIPLGNNLNTLALSPDGATLYASSRGKNNPVDYTKKGPDYGRVFAVDTRTFRVKGFVYGRNQPTGLAVSPDGRWLAFSNFLDDSVELYRINGSR